jgi:hypothetical protein
MHNQNNNGSVGKKVIGRMIALLVFRGRFIIITSLFFPERTERRYW